MTLATFIVLATAVGYALIRGQEIAYVDLRSAKIAFLGSKRVEVTKVREASDDLERRVQELEVSAKTKAKAEADAGTSEQPAEEDITLTGDWFGGEFRYRIEQFGSEVVVSEIHPRYGTTGVGDGEFDGETLTMTFVVADGSTGHAELRLAGPNRLQGTFVNDISGTRVAAVLTRGRGPQP